MKIGILVPHIFMQDKLLPKVIFAPAKLAISLAEEIQDKGHEVTLFSPGNVTTKVKNINADLSYFETELAGRGDDYISLLRKHPFTFITLARQVQGELTAAAMKMANNGELDILHVYTNEEDLALPFAQLCNKPVVFTHHDPFNFLVKYKNLFPKYSRCNWISVSMSQRPQMPAGTKWIANIYHGLSKDQYRPQYSKDSDYIAYLGRIINTKGVHLAIKSVQEYNRTTGSKLKLKIAGKHYGDHEKDKYWKEQIEPELNDDNIEYVGYLKTIPEKQEFLGGAKALLFPSTFEEPFGMVAIEALACATPVIGLDSGAIPEIIKDGVTGFIAKKNKLQSPADEQAVINGLSQKIAIIDSIDRHECRQDFESRFTADRMAAEHIAAYSKLIKAQPAAP
jgi:glycosyltransferase involved in cell wall biosynthesis